MVPTKTIIRLVREKALTSLKGFSFFTCLFFLIAFTVILAEYENRFVKLSGLKVKKIVLEKNIKGPIQTLLDDKKAIYRPKYLVKIKVCTTVRWGANVYNILIL